MSGLYPAARRWRIWTMLGVIVAMSGLTWGVVGRSLSSLFNRPVLIGLAAFCAIAIIFPLTRPSSPILIGLVVLLCAAAFAGQQLGRRYPGLGKFLSAGWFTSYFVMLWLLSGGDLRDSLLFLAIVLAVAAVAGWQLASRVSLLPQLGFLEKLVLFVIGFVVTYVVIQFISGLIGFDISVRSVSTSDWGGLTLTLLLAITGIALCFPIGVIMALGRRSELPVVKGLSIAYIELIRGVPLISILFMGQVMIPLFLPEGVRPDRVVRAIIGLTIFSSAYLAENVRAGLQAVPRGQFEAAASMGLNKPLTLGLIVLPQALKTAIPAIVGQFISLFQDTTLLGVVGLVELLGISNSILANPKYLGRYSEVYLFIAVLYWFFCYAMSLASRRLEQQLNTER
ncbi:MAG: ABC transporter permease subunit [Leptolyngbya sp. SIO4C1]|nr:ABC transporter permease subunit [Leptolyngbya sp. SIO4C1]